MSGCGSQCPLSHLLLPPLLSPLSPPSSLLHTHTHTYTHTESVLSFCSQRIYWHVFYGRKGDCSTHLFDVLFGLCDGEQWEKYFLLRANLDNPPICFLSLVFANKSRLERGDQC